MNTPRAEYGIGDVPDVPGPDEATTGRRDELRATLATCRFDPGRIPKPLRAIYTLAGIPICTPGNLSVFAGQTKAGKSAAVESAIAAVITNDPYADTLSFKSSNPDGRALLHFDTEQSEDDHWNLINRALKRAGLTREQKPAWLLSYSLSGKTANECRELMDEAMIMAREQFGGIHSSLIDGAADLVNDVNDPRECNPFVANLHGQARNFDCSILSVLHFNPQTSRSNSVEKTRGHLGSQLERKAETNLRLERNPDGITEIWSEKQRRAPILHGHGPCFCWSDEKGMHVSCESVGAAKDKERTERHRMEVADVWRDRGGLKYSDAIQAIKTTLGVKDTTAGERFRDYRKAELIKQRVANLWEKAV